MLKYYHVWFWVGKGTIMFHFRSLDQGLHSQECYGTLTCTCGWYQDDAIKLSHSGIEMWVS